MSAATALLSSCSAGGIGPTVAADQATAGTASSAPAPSETLLASWLFDDTDTTTLPDQTGHHDGTVIDVVKSGHGYYDFPGVTGARVTVDSLGRLPAGSWDNGWTLEAWVRFDSVRKEQAILKWNTNGGGHAFGLILDEPTFLFKTADGDGNVQIFSDGSPIVGKLYHVAVTSTPLADGSSLLAMYVNGEQQTATAPSPDPARTTIKPPTVDGLFTIGGEYDEGDDGVAHPASPLDGRIYRAAAYGQALSPAAIAAHYSAGPDDNRPPVAEAGPDQSVPADSTVTLDGSASTDPDGDPLTYRWAQTGGTPVTLSDPTAVHPSFTSPTEPGVLIFQLIAIDSGAAGSRDTVAVTVPVTAANRPPVAEAGPDQSVPAGSTVTLDGSAGTEPDGDPLTYRWTQTSGAPVTLSDPTAVHPSFTSPTDSGTLTFQLTVTDSYAASSTDALAVTVPAVIEVNRPPVARAGPDRSVPAGSTVTLDGSASTDSDSDPLTYQWTQTKGAHVTLSDRSATRPTFTAPANTTLVFQLSVTDSHGAGSWDTVQLTATDSRAASSTDTGTVAVGERHKR